MKPFYHDNHITHYCMNFLDNDLPDECAQMVVTSPPYWGLRKYAGEQELIWGGDKKCEHEWVDSSIPKSGGVGDYEVGRVGNAKARSDSHDKKESSTCHLCGAWKGAYGLEPTPEMYVEHTIEIFEEVKRVLRSDGVCFVNIGDSYYASGGASTVGALASHTQGKVSDFSVPYPYYTTIPHLKAKDLCLIPQRLAIAFQDAGWWARSIIIWSKSNPMPESVTDRPTESHEYILMLTKSARYYWDASAVREGADPAGATNGAPLGSSTLAPELGVALLADNATSNLSGRCYLSESQITINGTVAWGTKGIEVIKAISLTVIGEQTERQFMIDLEPIGGTASLTLIASTLKDLSANNTPVRATIVNSPTPPSGAIDTDSVLTIPSTNTSPTTEAVKQAFTMLASIAEKGLPTLVTIHSEKMDSPLLIRGTLRPTHIDHNTINTNVSQGRNLRSVWEFPTQPYPEAHFAVFPEKLPETCIKAATPEVGCCSKCGAPWERITENKPMKIRRTDWGDKAGNRTASSGTMIESNSSKTLGWQPTCKCNVDKVPSIVLDPFAGAGTTLWVAKKLNRKAIGFDISEEYSKLAMKRNLQQVGL